MKLYNLDFIRPEDVPDSSFYGKNKKQAIGIIISPNFVLTPAGIVKI